MVRKITSKQWTQAFLIGIIGSLIFKGVEYLGQLAFGWSILSGETWYWVLLSQLTFLIIVSGLLVFLLMKLFKKVWVIAFVPFLYYLIKEIWNYFRCTILNLMNNIVPITACEKVLWIASLESLIGIPIGFGVYYLIKKIWK